MDRIRCCSECGFLSSKAIKNRPKRLENGWPGAIFASFKALHALYGRLASGFRKNDNSAAIILAFLAALF
jgi:hypothetical protein